MASNQEKKLKVLFIVKWYPDKSDPQLGVFIKKHAQAVALYSHVAVLYISAFNPEYQAVEFYMSEERNVRQFFLYYKQSHFKIFNAFKYFQLVIKGWKVVLKNFGKPDIIHAHVLLKPWIVSYLLSKKFDVPFLITDHWTGFVNGKFSSKPQWYRVLAKGIAKRAGGFTVVSQSMKQALKNTGFLNKIDTIPNVVDLPHYSAFISQGKKKIVIVADLLDEQKNISAVIQVIGNLTRIRHDFECHVIGGGPDEAMLKELAGSNGTINSTVYFHGRRSNAEVYGYLQEAAFVLVNSNFETFSVVTAEALACGKPVIATISGGPEEILTAQTGILIQRGDNHALEKAINSMLDTYLNYDPVLLRAVVEEKYSREATGASFIKLYKGILSEKNGKEQL